MPQPNERPNRHTTNPDGTPNGRWQCRPRESGPVGLPPLGLPGLPCGPAIVTEASDASTDHAAAAPPPAPRPRATSTVEPLLLNKRDAAALCGICPSTLDKHRAAGFFPQPVKIGTALRWRVADLRAWIDAGCPREQS